MKEYKTLIPHPFSDAELEEFERIAVKAEGHTSTPLDMDDLFYLCLRMVDFDVPTKYRSMYNLPDDINKRMTDWLYAEIQAGKEFDMDKVPGFLLADIMLGDLSRIIGDNKL